MNTVCQMMTIPNDPITLMITIKKMIIQIIMVRFELSLTNVIVFNRLKVVVRAIFEVFDVVVVREWLSDYIRHDFHFTQVEDVSIVVDHSMEIFVDNIHPIQIMSMDPMKTMDHQVVGVNGSLNWSFYLILIEGFYPPPNDFYGPPFRGRGFFRRGGYGQGFDPSDQEGYNGFRGFRRGRGRGRGRGSGRRGGSTNEQFVFHYRSNSFYLSTVAFSKC